MWSYNGTMGGCWNVFFPTLSVLIFSSLFFPLLFCLLYFMSFPWFPFVSSPISYLSIVIAFFFYLKITILRNACLDYFFKCLCNLSFFLYGVWHSVCVCVCVCVCVWPVIHLFHQDPRVTLAHGSAVPSVLTKLGDCCGVSHTHAHTDTPDTPVWHRSTEGLSRLNSKHTHAHKDAHTCTQRRTSRFRLWTHPYSHSHASCLCPPASHIYPCDSLHLLQHTQPRSTPPPPLPEPQSQLPSSQSPGKQQPCWPAGTLYLFSPSLVSLKWLQEREVSLTPETRIEVGTAAVRQTLCKGDVRTRTGATHAHTHMHTRDRTEQLQPRCWRCAVQQDSLGASMVQHGSALLCSVLGHLFCTQV